jgi:hypothetical protein
MMARTRKVQRPKAQCPRSAEQPRLVLAAGWDMLRHDVRNSILNFGPLTLNELWTLDIGLWTFTTQESQIGSFFVSALVLFSSPAQN